MTNLTQIYANQILICETKISRLKKLLVFVSVVRFAGFIVAVVSPFYIYPLNPYLGIIVPLLSLVFFFFFVKKYQVLSRQKRFEQHKIEINQNELKALEHDFSLFEEGDEFIDPNHINAYDLDLFGRGSIFQFLNRTVTLNGKKKLATLLQQPLLDAEAIKQRQQLVIEFRDADLNWRQDFSAQGKMYDEEETESKLFDKWGDEDFSLKTQSYIKYLLIVLPIIAIGSLLFWIFAGNSAIFTLSVFLQMGVWLAEKNNIKIVYNQFGKRVQVLDKYGKLLQYIEKFEWKSDEGKALYKQLKEQGLPSVEIIKLKKLISEFDNRNNLFLGVVLNLVFVWDACYTFKLITWHNRNRANYQLWNQTIAYIDAVNSLANFSFNHPEFVFPEFVTGNFQLTATQLGHPLIHPSKRIDNNFEFTGPTGIMIITGANMAGKSTFLRTVGVNMVLGMCGAPVCARQMTFKPVEVFSNMRTTDSLFDDESYFFAELKRIKAILDEMDKGRELLIILDEILKGTNSVDKLAGSQKLVQRLIRQKASAIIATHDLKLTEIEIDYPAVVKNKCFEISIENDEMLFDYQLRDGVTTVMNATFLMKKMGIIS